MLLQQRYQSARYEGITLHSWQYDSPQGVGGVEKVQSAVAKGSLTVLAPDGLLGVAEAWGVHPWWAGAVAISLHMPNFPGESDHLVFEKMRTTP